MSSKITWDNEIPEKAKEVIQNTVDALWDSIKLMTVIIGNESAKEVPFKEGILQKSWKVEPLKDELGFEVSYNTRYAHRMHEHPEYHFKNGRKAKYLEDPLYMDKGNWQEKGIDKLKQILK